MTLDACPSDAELLRRLEQKQGKTAGSIMLPPSAIAPAGVKLGTARPRSTRGVMNRTEARVAAYLEREKAEGRVIAYYFDALSIRLADATHYRPDFVVLLRHFLGDDDILRVVILEAKGHWEDDARAKFKIAAQQYPHFTFIACRRLKKGETPRWSLIGLDGFEAETLAPRRL